jgi:hypothetical protein
LKGARDAYAGIPKAALGASISEVKVRAFKTRSIEVENGDAGHALDGISGAILQLIELYINAIDLKPYAAGTEQPKMNQARMNSIRLALPPEAEQHRIIARAKELIEVCDKLEK